MTRPETSACGHLVARDLALLGAAVLAVYSILCHHPLLGTYPRYVLAAREMLEGGDWVVPHLNGEAYFEKPILLYWFAALSQQLLGTSPFAIHLPSGLASFVSVACTYELGRELRGRRFGLFAALMLLLSAEFLVMTTMLTTDPLFSGWLALSWLAWWKHHRGRGAFWIWIFWGAIGLAWLTKGPLGFVLPLLSIGSHALITGGRQGAWEELKRLKAPYGMALIVGINLPWHVLVWLRDPRYLEMFYDHINLRGLYDPSINHGGPVYYYLLVMALALVPWTVPGLIALGSSLWTSSRAALRRSRDGPGRIPEGDGARTYLACSVVFPIAFLSAISSKLGTYLLPILPLAVLLVADLLWSVGRQPPRWLRHACTVQAAIFGLAAGCAVLLRDEIPLLRIVDREGWRWLAAGTLMLLLGPTAGAIAVARGWVAGGFLLSGLWIFGAVALLLPNADRILPDLYGGRLATAAASRSGPDDVFVVSGQSVQDYTIPIAIHRRVAILGRAKELGMGCFTEVTLPDQPLPDDPYAVSGANLPENEWLYTLGRLCGEWNGPRRIWLFGNLRPGRADDMRTILEDRGLDVYQLGCALEIQLLTNRPL